MLMKNNKNIFLYLILIFFSLIQSLAADEFDITASNIKLFKDNMHRIKISLITECHWNNTYFVL